MHSREYEANVKILICLFTFLIVSASARSAEIKYQPGDEINITVYNSPELTGSFKIYTDGYLRIPLIGKVYAKDKTENELYESIRSAVDAFIKNPYITIIPKFTVTVIGNVNRPGSFTVTGAEKVIEMVALAGGFDKEASGKITLNRNGKKIKISPKSVINSDASLGFLMPGDVIVAERKTFTRSDYSIIISTISTVTVSIYYFFIR
jgi:protein involved in polysaccharide export with SLBB domain